MHSRLRYCVAASALLLLSSGAFAEDYVFSDPTGDDNGPGNYVYPTDAVYTPGSFDLTELKVTHKGGNVTFATSVNQKLQDPWGMGGGFAVQMMFIFIDKDGASGSGHTEGLPGLNIQFAPSSAWEKVVILSPQPQSRVNAEIKTKAAAIGGDIVVPRRTTGRGKTISGKVKLNDLGGGDPAAWRYQVVVQSNEGFPEKTDLLSRKVNEFEGQHRFGGGNDYNCDPHVMDILAPPAQGGAGEIDAQHAMLAYECDGDGNSVKMATLEMVSK